MTDREKLSKNLDKVMSSLDLYPDAEIGNSDDQTVAQRRRRRNGRKPSLVGTLSVLEQDGVFRLSDSPTMGSQPSSARRSSRRNRGSGRRVMGTVVDEQAIQLLPHSQIPGAIAKLDYKLTPERGLRQVKGGKIVKNNVDVTPIKNGKILLFVHGTFSNSESFFKQISRPSYLAGKAFIKWTENNYKQILTFDHPTLAVSPLVNARQLALILNGSNADIDIVCHSRGGIVTRWWLEAFDRGMGNRRVVFVGCPLNGTGLAAPPNIRKAMNMAFTFGNSMSKVTAAVPFLVFATGLFQVVSSVTRIAAKTPLVDSLVAMVPGLVAQSRVENNFERVSMRLDSYKYSSTNYFAITSNFESEKVGWEFWKKFRKRNIMDSAADRIFDGNNDLVVDTVSMTNLQDGLQIPKANTHDFGTTDKVHHTNYFEQKDTLEFIMSKLR